MSHVKDIPVSPRSPVLVVAGMHRSGTSCVAELFASAGLALGDKLLEADARNPRGYFEDREIVDFHRKLLSAHGLADDGLVGDVRIEPTAIFCDEAMTLIEARRGILRPWGWKDPRTVLFLRLWCELVPDARYFFVFRPPWDVVDSLFRRGDRVFTSNPRFALTVWMAYNTRIRDFARLHPDRVLVRELLQVVSDPDAVCDAVRNQLGIQLELSCSTVHPALLSRADPKHAAFLAEAGPECVALLEELRLLAGVAGAAPHPEVEVKDAIALDQGMMMWQRHRARERLTSPKPQQRSARTGRRVFIAVPVYEGTHFVAETLRSIQRQEHHDFTVCISIDGDDQRSAEACFPFLQDSRFEMYVQPRQLGWAGNLNWLIDRCDGDFFCFWQQDDLAAESYLSRLVNHATRHPEAACLFSEVQWFGTRIDRVETPPLVGFALERVLQQLEHGYYAPFFGIVRADLLKRVGHIRITPCESALEDQVWLAALAANGPWLSVPDTLYFKRGHAGETHLVWERSADNAQRRSIWLEWGCGMLEAVMSVTPPQEHGRMFDVVLERLTVARKGRWLFYDARAARSREYTAFRDDFTRLAQERYGITGTADRLLKWYGGLVSGNARVQLVTAAGEPGKVILGSGWSVPEANGVWSNDTESVLRLPLVGSGPWKCLLYLIPYPSTDSDRLLVVRAGCRVVAERNYPAEAPHSREPLEFTIDAPGSLVLAMPWAVSPRQLGHSDDDRRLGVCLHRVVVERVANMATQRSKPGRGMLGHGLQQVVREDPPADSFVIVDIEDGDLTDKGEERG